MEIVVAIFFMICLIFCVYAIVRVVDTFDKELIIYN